MARSSARCIEAIVQVISEASGSFGLHCDDDGEYTAALEWGHEAPDSPMVGAAAYGVGGSASEAIDQMLDEAGVK